MSQAAIIVNVSNQPQLHSNGLSGTWTVPDRKEGEDFAMLVVYPTPEIQDIGSRRTTVHWLKALPLALDIVGMRSDAAAHGIGVSGNKEKWGLLLCEAQPDLPKSLLTALEAEMEFLNQNPPDVKMRKDNKSGALVAINIEDDETKAIKIKLSRAVADERADFEAECRRLVTRKEVIQAKRNLQVEDQRLVAEGDRMWARPTEQPNINELHRNAAGRLGIEKPWHYSPQQLIACPGCGSMIKENILSCPACAGWLDEGIEELRKLPPKQRSRLMYPTRDSEAPSKGATVNA